MDSEHSRPVLSPAAVLLERWCVAADAAYVPKALPALTSRDSLQPVVPYKISVGDCVLCAEACAPERW